MTTDRREMRLVDYTTLATVERCEAEAVYRHVLHLTRPESESAALHIGKAVHYGLKGHYQGCPLEECLHMVEDEWRAGGAPDVLLTKKGTPDFRTLAKAKDVVEMYAKVHPAGEFEVLDNEQYLQSTTERLDGIVDRVVRRKFDGGIYPMDTKTSSLFMGEYTLETWRFHLQAHIQMRLVQHKLGAPVAGFCYDGIYLARSKLVATEHFTRFWIPYDAAIQEQLGIVTAQRLSTWEYVRTVAPSILGTPLFAALMRTGSCVRYNSLCPFFRFCAAPMEDREELVQIAKKSGELMEAEWNPATRV